MIKYHINGEEGTLSLHVEGDISVIAADTTMLISKIYRELDASSAKKAKIFMKMIKMAVNSGIAFADEDECEKILKKKNEELKESIAQQILDALHEAINRGKDDTDED